MFKKRRKTKKIRSGITVLLIENESVDSDRLIKMLEYRNGYSGMLPKIAVRHCKSLEYGLRCLRENRFDAVLLDLSVVPDSAPMRGLQTIIETAPDIPVIVLTGREDYKLEIEALSRGARDYLIKSQIDANLLIRSLYYAIERNRLQINSRKYIHRLESSELHFRNIIENNADAMVVVDREGSIRYANNAAETLFRRKRDDLIGQPFGFPIVAGETTELDIFRKGEDHATAEMRVVESEWEGETVFLASLRDVTGRKEAESQLEKIRRLERYLAYHDTLTNLPNRTLFYDRLKQAIAVARRNNDRVAVLFLDLDGFKRINDTLGHSKGDILLQMVAQRLKSSVRECDTIARLGGDEFTVVLIGIDGPDDAARVAEKILKSMSRPFSVTGNEVHISTSIGIGLFPNDSEDIETLVRNADIAMYHAKYNGKNNYQLFNPGMTSAIAHRLAMENALRKAVERNEFIIHYQPQYDIRSGDVVGLEALVRWAHPDKGLLYPGEFIPIAEETGTIMQVSEWVLEQACRQSRLWNRSAGWPVRVAINISPLQFTQKNLVRSVYDILDETGMNPLNLELEITEGSAMKDVEYTVKTLKELKKMGIRISVDDFGTGYSSMGYLKRFPIDLLKIDRSFIRHIPEDKDNSAITSAIIALAHSMGLKVLAEGVENQRQYDFLKSIGCDEIQGFYCSKPLELEAVEKLLERNRTAIARSECILM